MKTKRSPPPSSSKSTKSKSEQSNVVEETVSPSNVTQKAKRPRIQDDNISDELSSFKSELMSIINNFMETQSGRLEALEKLLKSVQEQNKTIQSTNRDIEKAMSHLSDDIKAIEKKIDYLDQERKNIHIEILSLEEKLDTFEMNSIVTSAEIRNVPKSSKESKDDLWTYVIKLSKVLNINLQSHDLRNVSRLPSKKEKLSSSISIDFNNTLIKTAFLDGVKNYNKNNSEKLNASHLGMLSTKQPIYISEQLTPKMKRLLFLTRDFSKSSGFKFVWTSNGRIYLRKEEGKPHILVKNESHLNDLKKKQSENLTI
ncbi:unnamed protein product [Plutella xylostella]|uniref:(diamondback moth) hypothetical protein n=1 Tax=Plutella xylostella TaxID=51655 RepID=A0A8S4EV61_PLUXY|nr:unnamed protein product [Plutella xylostella]